MLAHIWSALRLVTALFSVCPLISSNALQFYWNIPSSMCHKYKITFSHLSEAYGIEHNSGDKFLGDKITILYDPGMFPALLQNTSSSTLVKRNGGVPQATTASVDAHLRMFERHLDEQIPDVNFNGIAIIDFESWRPIFRQNFGTLKPYKDESYRIERERHVLWPKDRIETEAAKRFETAGKEFMLKTIWTAKNRRPNAQWGYYAFPYCFNSGGTKRGSSHSCAPSVIDENNRIGWLFDNSDIVLPSVYQQEANDAVTRFRIVEGRVREAKRVADRTGLKLPVLTYVRYVFTDSNRHYLSESDLLGTMNAIRSAGSSSVILWGSSNDLNTKEKCIEFEAYVKNTLGPVVRSFTERKISVVNP